jgi:hypothetical protein
MAVSGVEGASTWTSIKYACVYRQVEEPARGRECYAPTSVDCSAAQDARPAPAHEQRSLVFYPDLPMVSVDPASSNDRPSRDAGTLASDRLSLLLAAEIIVTGRAAADRNGIAGADPADEHRESTLGRAAHPRRTGQARLSRRSASRNTWSSDVDSLTRNDALSASIPVAFCRRPLTHSRGWRSARPSCHPLYRERRTVSGTLS